MKIEKALGFRPFYLLAALFAVGGMLFWQLSYSGAVSAGVYLTGVFWHGHEMVYGFAVAVMSGFLLTAVRNWTGLPTPTGLALGALASLWVLGRVLILTGPEMPAALVDVLFIPALLVAVAFPILKSRNRRNYKILLLLLLLSVAHVVYHMAFLGSFPSWLNRTSIIVAMELFTVLYALVGGRVIPAFTRNAVPDSEPTSVTWVEVLAFGSLIAMTMSTIARDWTEVPTMLPVVLLLVASAAHLARLGLWQPRATLPNPLLWMLPVAYSWLPVALFLRALGQIAIVSPAIWIHALMTGAITSMMMAMMMRSTLGHTGRTLAASRTDVTAFLVLQLAAVVRVIAGFTSDARHLVLVSGVLWILAFALFLLRYVPMLTQPRIDGRTG